MTLIFKEFPSFLCLEWTPYLTLVILPILGWILVGLGKSFGRLLGSMLALERDGFGIEGSWRGLGGSWRPLEGSWKGLGGLLKGLGGVLEDS